KPKTRIRQQVGEFIQAGGKPVVLTEHELRAVLAARVLTRANPPGLAEWRQRARPLSQLGVVRSVLDLDKISTASPAPPEPATTAADPAPVIPAAPARPATAAPEPPRRIS